MRRKIGDRRIRPRFDIVGDLWGSLETVLRLPLRNVSRGGALIHSHVPLAVSVGASDCAAGGWPGALGAGARVACGRTDIGRWRADVFDRGRVPVGAAGLARSSLIGCWLPRAARERGLEA